MFLEEGKRDTNKYDSFDLESMSLAQHLSIFFWTLRSKYLVFLVESLKPQKKFCQPCHFIFGKVITADLYINSKIPKGTLLQLLVIYLSMWQLCGMLWNLTVKQPSKGELSRPKKNTWDNWHLIGTIHILRNHFLKERGGVIKLEKWGNIVYGWSLTSWN